MSAKTNFDLLSWRITSSSFGSHRSDSCHEEYRFSWGSVARVFLVPKSWIQKKYLPPKFFKNFPSSAGGAVGCVKFKIASTGQYHPCIMHNTNISSKVWSNHIEWGDPLMYIIDSMCNRENREKISLFQSMEDSGVIGIVRSVNPFDIEPEKWSKDDNDIMFDFSKPSI